MIDKLMLWLIVRGQSVLWFTALLRKEFRSRLPVSLGTRMRMWRRGFLGESSVIYGLESADMAEYLSDYCRFVRTPRINGKHARILNSKLLFNRVLGKYDEYLPEIFCTLDSGKVIVLSDRHAMNSIDDVIDGCLKLGKVVAKPVSGGGGSGIAMISCSAAEAFEINGRQYSRDELRLFLAGLRNSMIVEFVAQDKYAADISPYATNTIRVLTMWDYDRNEPFVAAAVHRFGSINSTPVDNWTQGGLSCVVDLEEGRLGKGVSYPAHGELVWHAVHPDTGVEVEGKTVPHWESIREGILGMARYIPFIPYIGWDIVVTGDGFKVLEGNSYSDVNLFQVHVPLLRTPRIRRFYEINNVVGAPPGATR